MRNMLCPRSICAVCLRCSCGCESPPWAPRSIRGARRRLRSPELRRVESAWAGYYVADWSAFVALSIYAYDFGGAAAVGLLGLVRALPAALGVPAGSAAADRTRRERVLFVVQATRAVALAASAVVVAVSGPHWAVFLLVGITAGLGAAYRPAQLALVPLLARTPQELVATNVSGSILEGLAVLIGPALAGILLTFTGIAVVLAICAAISPGPHSSSHVSRPGRTFLLAGAARSRI